jgi:hypothetical protein
MPSTTGLSVRRSFAGAISLLVATALVGSGVAQGPVPTPRPAPPSLCQQFDVNAATVQHVAPAFAANGDATVEVEFAGTLYHLAVQPVDVRTPDFKLFVRDATGLHQIPAPPSVTYQGVVLEDGGAWVAATIVGPSVTAMVRMGDGTCWGVQPIAGAQPRVGPGAHIVYRQADNVPLPWGCGTVTPPGNPGGGGGTGTDVAMQCDLACEADPMFYQQDGSNTTTTQNDITGVVNAMTTIYQSNVSITFLISQIIVDTGADPYNTSVAGTLLNQFANNWNAVHGGVQRDTAHLFTGRPMGQASGGAIGIAFLGTTCNIGSAYGVSQSHFTTNFTSRVAVTAHEIGHNFGAQHCDATPPCYIMCSGIGGCNNVQNAFSPGERAQITAYAQSVSCLTIVQTVPAITSYTPNTPAAFQPGVLSLTGTGFTGVNQVTIGSQTITTGITITNDTHMSVQIPPPAALGLTIVNVTNSAGTSNSVALNFVATNPCAMTVPVAVLGGNNLTWSFGGQPSDVWVLLISPVNTTTPFQGWPIVDQPDIFALGLLSATVGLGSNTVTVPPGTFSGVTVYSQMVELVLGAPDLTVDSSSAVRSTLVIN